MNGNGSQWTQVVASERLVEGPQVLPHPPPDGVLLRGIVDLGDRLVFLVLESEPGDGVPPFAINGVTKPGMVGIEDDEVVRPPRMRRERAFHSLTE